MSPGRAGSRGLRRPSRNAESPDHHFFNRERNCPVHCDIPSPAVTTWVPGDRHDRWGIHGPSMPDIPAVLSVSAVPPDVAGMPVAGGAHTSVVNARVGPIGIFLRGLASGRNPAARGSRMRRSTLAGERIRARRCSGQIAGAFRSEIAPPDSPVLPFSSIGGRTALFRLHLHAILIMNAHPLPA